MGSKKHELRAVPDALPAITLGLGGLVAVVWSWSSWSSYHRSFTHHIFSTDASTIIANGLLTVLFLAIGMELAAERREGALRDLRHAMAPLAGAIGGMLATALLSVLGGLLLTSPTLLRGWGVPMATDVAFVIGVLALVGSRLPRELRTFLLTLAIADDVGSLGVLGATGSIHANVDFLLAALAVSALAWFGRTKGPALPLLALAPLWYCLARSGTEPALAGVIIGGCMPPHAITVRLERLASWGSGLVVLPLFALSACGLNWHAVRWNGPTYTIVGGMVAIRLLGKSIGIVGVTLLANRLGAPLTQALSPRRLLGAGLLCDMGFTVPLLFARVVFGEGSSPLSPITIGLLVATVLGGASGALLLRSTEPESSPPSSDHVI